MTHVCIEYDYWINQTQDAELFCIESSSLPDGEDWSVWIPKSQIEEHDEDEKCFWIPEWLAKEKELI